MTVIKPNSIAGITSLTALSNNIEFYTSSGTLAGLNLSGVNLNTPSGISTFNNVNISGVATASGFVGNLTGTATGLSGTPNITVGVITAASASFSGNVSIAGTLTYEDVTNVDSIGLVTARSGAHVTGGNLLVGTSSSTGTEAQPLQVSGSGYLSGRLGIGVTAPVTNTQVAIAGTLGISEVGGAGTRTLFTSSTSGFILNHNHDSSTIFQNQGIERLRVTPVGQVLVGASSTTGTSSQPLQVTGGAYVSGNVGLGTTNPTFALDVNGLGRFVNSFADIKLLNNHSASAQGYRFALDGGSPNNLYFQRTSNNFSTANVVFVVDSNSNILINSTSATGTSSQPLQVTGGAYVSGNVGIGTTNPLSPNGAIPKLHIEGGGSSGGALYLNNPSASGIQFSPSTLGMQYFPTESGSSTTARYFIRFDTTNDASYPYLTNRAPNGDFAIFSGTTAGSAEIERLRFKGGDGVQSVYFSNSNVGIGLTNPSTALQVNGTATVTTLVETSSITLKENINPIVNALDKVVQLNPVTYDRKSGESKNEAGLIAEEVNDIIPNIVSKDDEGNPNGINYTKLSVYLIDAIKELKKQIDELKG